MGILRLYFTDDIHKVYVRTEGRRLPVGRSQPSINVPRYGLDIDSAGCSFVLSNKNWLCFVCRTVISIQDWTNIWSMKSSGSQLDIVKGSKNRGSRTSNQKTVLVREPRTEPRTGWQGAIPCEKVNLAALTHPSTNTSRCCLTSMIACRYHFSSSYTLRIVYKKRS